MCGIVGLIPKFHNGLTATQQKMFSQMLYADAVRGWDATGVIGVQKNGDFTIMKEAAQAAAFAFEDSSLDNQLYQTGVAVIGHNRAKTIGKNVDENAHPFVEGGTFAMVHNGTLQNHKKMHDTEVDSHALTITFKKAMEQDDWKKAMEDALGSISGALACVWYDQTKHQLCMIRNSQRPLGIVRTKSTVLFGSEIPMLCWIALRNGEAVEEQMSLKEHTLYTFDLSKTGGVVSETNLSPTIQHKGFTNGIIVLPNTGKSNSKSKSETTHTLTVIGSTGTTGNDTVGKPPVPGIGPDKREVLSKSAYKRLRSQIFRRAIRFDVEDIFGLPEARSVMLLGVSVNGAYDLCDIRHSIRADLEFRKHGFHNLYELWYNGVEFEGIVSDTEYDRTTGGIIIAVEGLKNVTEGFTYGEEAKHSTH